MKARKMAQWERDLYAVPAGSKMAQVSTRWWEKITEWAAEVHLTVLLPGDGGRATCEVVNEVGQAVYMFASPEGEDPAEAVWKLDAVPTLDDFSGWTRIG